MLMLGDSVVKNLPAKQEMWDRSLGRQDSPGGGNDNYCSVLAWEVPWTEEPGGLQSVRSQKSQTRRSDQWMTVEEA